MGGLNSYKKSTITDIRRGMNALQNPGSKHDMQYEIMRNLRPSILPSLIESMKNCRR